MRPLLVALCIALSPAAWADEPDVGVVVPRTGEPFVLYRESQVMLGQGYLGVELVDLTPELRSHFGGNPDVGVLIGSVEPGSPAAKADIRVGDVLTHVAGKPVQNSWDVIRAVRPLKAGTAMQVDTLRDRKARRVQVTVIERPREPLVIDDIDLDLEGLDEGMQAYVRGALEKAFETPAMLPGEDVEGFQQRMKQLEARLAELEARLADPK